MTSEEKANELIEKYKSFIFPANQEAAIAFAKKCALVCVEEILSEMPDEINTMSSENPVDFITTDNFRKRFYLQVKIHLIETK